MELRERYQLHDEACASMLASWANTGVRTPNNLTEHEAALWALRYGGSCFRLSGHLPARLTTLPMPDRVRLAKTAFTRWRFALPDYWIRLAELDCPEPEDIDQLECWLYRTDEFEAALAAAVELTGPQAVADTDLLETLTQARCQIAAVVQQYAKYPDVAALASRFVRRQREPRYLDDGRPADWFTKFCELDCGFSSADLADLRRR